MAAAVQTRPRFEIGPIDKGRAGVRRTPLRTRYFAGDGAVERFLGELESYGQSLSAGHDADRGWLLPFRNDFRFIVGYRPCAGLRECLRNGDPTSASYFVALWLLSCCATPQVLYELDRQPADTTPVARKHYARALRRVGAWPRLRRLAADYPDDQYVATLVAGSPGDAFPGRLQRFAQHVDDSHAAEAALVSQMPLWVREGELTTTPAKSTGWIRVLLERIKEWVRSE